MASSVGGGSSSSSDTFNSTTPLEYEVFLSFAGKDTRLNFTDHLYEAFIRSGIRCFKDDVDLPKGEDLNDLFRAIRASHCAVLVISQNYAKSTWCLDELQQILESREKLGRRIIPIFYNVNPADVKHQRESFGEALAEYEKKKSLEHTTKVQNWKTALSKIGNMSGWDTRNKHEADLIKNIVGDVWSFLSTKLPSFNNNLVGIDSKVADVIPFLKIGLDDKCFVGIWGMGGVGKTTLARVVFEKLSEKFDICCFLEKVKDTLPKGLISLQTSLLSHLRIKDLKICDSYQGMQMIRTHLCEKKVLLVLDDVDDESQLKDLAESPDWFGKGSRIIITTRDSHLLTSFGVETERIYKMATMKADESLQLFSKKAFNKNCYEKKYLEYSKSVVKYAGGLPLALEALGSYLCGRSEEAVWRDVLDKLKQINPYKNILQVLKISYDGLDEKEQTIFLDIVCLFRGWEKEVVTRILKACDLNPIIGIKVLIEKTLLVETSYGILDMHDLYEELGRYIIQQKSPNSRLGTSKEFKEVLNNNKGFGEIEAIATRDGYHMSDKIVVHPEAFSRMSRLRLLFFGVAPNIEQGLEKLSGASKFIRWPSFPLEALPLPLDELVHIEMPKSSIKQLWNGSKSMNHLKFIDMSESPNLTETPDFSNVQSLERLILCGCHSLVRVHESLGVLKELVEVNLCDCYNLHSLPSELKTNSLKKLDLRRFENVKKLPEFGEGMKKLSYLDASRTAITTVPESLGSLTGLRELYLNDTGLTNLSTDCFSGLFELLLLSLKGCHGLETLPRLPPRLSRLEADGCFSMKSSLDDQILWSLVTSLDHECRAQTKYVVSTEGKERFSCLEDLRFLKFDEPSVYPLRDLFAMMPSGGKIPSWFDPNIEYFDDGSYNCHIAVDEPPNFRASIWSGVVVCLLIRGNGGGICCFGDVPGDPCMRSSWTYRTGDLWGNERLCVMVLGFNEYPRGHDNSLRIGFSCHYNNVLSKEDLDNADKYGNGKGDLIWWHRMEILGCGWRAICKEDIQNLCNPNHLSLFTQRQHAPPSDTVTVPLALLDKIIWADVLSPEYPYYCDLY